MDGLTKTEGSILAGRDCKEIVLQEYGIQAVSMVRQKGWCDVTYLVTDKDGEKYIFKVFIEGPGDSSSLEQTEAEISMINFLKDRGIPVPTVLKTRSGSYYGVTEFTDDEKGRHNKFFRMQTFVKGDMLGRRLNVTICSELGDLAGLVTVALADFHCDFYEARADRKFHVNFAENLTVFDMVKQLPDERNRQLANDYLKWYEETIGSKIDQFPTQQVHCDMHGSNLIVNEDVTKIIGLIDFSDSRKTLRLVEPTIALGSILMFSPEPLKCAEAFLKSFQKHINLLPIEKEALLPAITGRIVREMCVHNYLILNQPGYNRSYLDNIYGNGWVLVERFLDPNCTERQFFNNV